MNKDSKDKSIKAEEVIKEGSKEDIKREEAKTESDNKINELTNDLKRVQAEFENYKKRIEKECCEFKEYAKAEIIKEVLVVIDNFERALGSTDNKEQFVKGMELIYSQLTDILIKEGIRAIETENKKFDPYFHEALLSEKSDKEEATILEELQKGYLLKNKVLRHAKVKISK